jgi:hypothetical protein
LNTEYPEKRVFIGSWHVGSTGLNLQKQCNHSVEWDAPPSIGAMIQARSRSRRIGQSLAVENLEVMVENSFQNRIMRTTIMKSLPGVMAHLTINVGEVNDSFATGNDDDDIEIGERFLVDGELIQSQILESIICQQTRNLLLPSSLPPLWTLREGVRWTQTYGKTRKWTTSFYYQTSK